MRPTQLSWLGWWQVSEGEDPSSSFRTVNPDILSPLRWQQLLLEVCCAAQGRQEEKRCWKVSQEGQRPSEQTWDKAKKKRSKGKVWGTLSDLVWFDKATYDKL